MASTTALTRDEVERGYNNRAAVPDHPYWLEQFAARSESAVEALRPALDVRYGSGPKETLDLFLPATPARGTLMFIHGGYWRALDKAEHAFVAPVFVAAGYAVAVINYDLCPQVTVATIVDQCRRAVVWLVHQGPERGAPAPLVIAGHSAGGHLTAMMHRDRLARPRACPDALRRRRFTVGRARPLAARAVLAQRRYPAR